MARSFVITFDTADLRYPGGFAAFIQDIYAGCAHETEWIVSNPLIKENDIIYLLKLSEPGRGIVASGVSESRACAYGEKDSVKAKKQGKELRIVARFDRAVDYRKGEALNLDVLAKRCKRQKWDFPESGMEIREKNVPVLEELWHKCIDGASGERPLLPSDIRHNILLVRIRTEYYHRLSERGMYEWTRGFWNRSVEYVQPAQYALTVINGKVAEVYKIKEWIPAKDVDNYLYTYMKSKHDGKIAFVGKVARRDIRDYYIGRRVDSLYQYGESSRLRLFLKDGKSCFDDPREKNSRRKSAADKDKVSKVEKKANLRGVALEEPMMPKKRMRKADGTLRYICGRCEASFSKSDRCPECGQLVKVLGGRTL